MQYVGIEIANAYIARSPESSQTPSGTTKLKFSLPVNERDGEEETTTWYEVTVWGRAAEALISLRDRGLFEKGASVFVRGRLKVRPWTGRDGSQRMSLDVNADVALLLSPPKGYSEGGYEEEREDDLSQVPF